MSGYRATALGKNVFIKPVPKEHAAHFIIPDAYEPATDSGFVASAGPDVVGIKPGNLVLYDRFATTGNEFTLLDEDGELVPMVRLHSDFIYATLDRAGIRDEAAAKAEPGVGGIGAKQTARWAGKIDRVTNA